jgi:hypothetical protein
MCVWAYETIFSWPPEMNLIQCSLPAVFAAIPVLYTIDGSPLDSLHDIVLESLCESLVQSLLERAWHREE